MCVTVRKLCSLFRLLRPFAILFSFDSCLMEWHLYFVLLYFFFVDVFSHFFVSFYFSSLPQIISNTQQSSNIKNALCGMSATTLSLYRIKRSIGICGKDSCFVGHFFFHFVFCYSLIQFFVVVRFIIERIKKLFIDIFSQWETLMHLCGRSIIKIYIFFPRIATALWEEFIQFID